MTETKSKPGKIDPAEVCLIIEDRVMPLADFVAAATPKAAAVCWGAGYIEIGRRVHVVTGNPNVTLTREGESKSAVVVEDAIEWTGPKKAGDQPLAGVIEQAKLPTAERYRKYERTRNEQTGEYYLRPVTITRDEASEMCAYRVRLTDKGLAALAPEA